MHRGSGLIHFVMGPSMETLTPGNPIPHALKLKMIFMIFSKYGRQVSHTRQSSRRNDFGRSDDMQLTSLNLPLFATKMRSTRVS